MKIKVNIEVEIPDWLAPGKCETLKIREGRWTCPFFDSWKDFCNLFSEPVKRTMTGRDGRNFGATIRCQPCLDAIKEAQK